MFKLKNNLKNLGPAKHNTGFTLLELIVVVIVIGILASIALPIFTKAKEQAFDREANTVLRLVWVAERSFRMTQGCYYPNGTGTVTNLDDINSNLSIDLIPSPNWDFSITSPDSNSYNAYMVRTSGPGRTLFIPQTNPPTPTCASDCL